jgi:hypothetical protein
MRHVLFAARQETKTTACCAMPAIWQCITTVWDSAVFLMGTGLAPGVWRRQQLQAERYSIYIFLELQSVLHAPKFMNCEQGTRILAEFKKNSKCNDHLEQHAKSVSSDRGSEMKKTRIRSDGPEEDSSVCLYKTRNSRTGISA